MSRLSAAAVACAFLLSGCSLLGNGTPAPARSSAAPVAASPRLLAVADLPAGYRSVAVPSGGAGSLGGCPALDAQPSAATATAEALFTRTGTADTVAETLSDTTPADATATIATMGTAAAGCATFTTSVAGVKLPFATSALTLAPIGDQRVALRMVASVGGLTIEEDVAAVRHGGTLILVVFVSTGPPDASFLGSVVAAAYRRAASG